MSQEDFLIIFSCSSFDWYKMAAWEEWCQSTFGTFEGIWWF